MMQDLDIKFADETKRHIRFCMYSFENIELLKGYAESKDAYTYAKTIGFEKSAQLAPFHVDAYSIDVQKAFLSGDRDSPLVAFYSNEVEVKRHYKIALYFGEVIRRTRLPPLVPELLYTHIIRQAKTQGGDIRVAVWFKDLITSYSLSQDGAKMLFAYCCKERCSKARKVSCESTNIVDFEQLVLNSNGKRKASIESRQPWKHFNCAMELYVHIYTFVNSLVANYDVRAVGPKTEHKADLKIPVQMTSNFDATHFTIWLKTQMTDISLFNDCKFASLFLRVLILDKFKDDCRDIRREELYFSKVQVCEEAPRQEINVAQCLKRGAPDFEETAQKYKKYSLMQEDRDQEDQEEEQEEEQEEQENK